MSLAPVPPDADVQALMSEAEQDALAGAIHALDVALARADTRLGELAAEAAERRAKRQARPGTAKLAGSQGLKRQAGTGTLKLAAGQPKPARRPAPKAGQLGDPLARYDKAEPAGVVERLIAAVEAAEAPAAMPAEPAEG